MNFVIKIILEKNMDSKYYILIESKESLALYFIELF